MKEYKFCKFCGEKIEKDLVVCPKCGRQLKVIKNEEPKKIDDNIKEPKQFYKEDWFMWLTLILFAPIGIVLMWYFHPNMKKNKKIILSVLFAILFVILLVSTTGSSNNNSDDNKSSLNKKVSVQVVDFSTMSIDEINSWCNLNKINCNISQKYSDTIEINKFISQSISASKTVYQGSSVEIVFSLGKQPSTEYKNALKKAETYSKTMHMSKQAVYDQLVSEYGEKFTASEAQYAIDHLVADWNANALAKAKTYQKTMSMSKSAIYDQLISKYGEKFTASEAQYAIDHLDD